MIRFKNIKKKKQSNTQFSLATGEFDAAEVLIDRQMYREAVIHMYFCSFYLSQSICADELRSNPSHKSVESCLNRMYGNGRKDIARRYVTLHKELHQMRNKLSYRTPVVPPANEVVKRLKTLRAYLRSVNTHIEKVSTVDILLDIAEKNGESVRDFSYDIYCPRTYRHHNRITFWQPPFYVDRFSHSQLARRSREMLKGLRVKDYKNYVLGINSRVNQYSNDHYLLLDFDSLDTNVESALGNVHGVLMKSGRGYHFIGNKVIKGLKAWEKEMRRIGRIEDIKGRIDKDHIDISIQRGYSTLRVSTSPVKPHEPIFYKDM